MSTIFFWIFYIIAGGIAVTASSLQAVEDRYDYIHREKYNKTTSPVIRAYHVPQSYNRYDVQPIRYLDQRPYSQYRHHNRRKQSKSLYSKPGRNDVIWDSSERRPLTTGIFRTYGKGQAKIPRLGASVYVPKSSGHKKAHKGTITTRIVIPDEEDSGETNAVSRSRRDCSGCPDDHTVVASKGNTFVILPEPCPTIKWHSITGPRPGMKIREGRHTVVGKFGHRRKMCEYHYHVVVRHCIALDDPDLDITCTADDAWGSKCFISCGKNHEVVGASTLECLDNLTWSHPLPTCKSKIGCKIPKVPDESKLSCQTANQTELDQDLFPENSYCRFKLNNKESVIQCKNGAWERFQIPDTLGHFEIEQYKYATTTEDESENELENDPCDPNPCLNGGTCLRSMKDKAPPICICKPSTQGVRCQLKQCEFNICENQGLCFIFNGETMCYCLPGFVGHRCNHIVHDDED